MPPYLKQTEKKQAVDLLGLIKLILYVIRNPVGTIRFAKVMWFYLDIMTNARKYW